MPWALWRGDRGENGGLETEVSELALVCRTLLTVLRENAIVDPVTISETMRRIDLEDGVADGRVTPEAERPAAREARESPGPSRRPKRR